MAEEIKYLGTAGVQQLITNIRLEIDAAEQAAANTAQGKVDALANGQVKTNKEAIGTLTNLATNEKSNLVDAVGELFTMIGSTADDAQTAVNNLANGQVKANKEAIGTMGNLETTAKSDLVTAINEVRNAVSAGGTAAAITMTEVNTGLAEGILKAYTIKQGENTVGTINIPKDMVVQSGEVVTNPAGQPAGTYIKLTLANATNDIIYVNVGSLVDIYTVKANAAQIQLAIDTNTREISAAVVAGSITATELAANAVTTVKIADGNVTKAKLESSVQTSLGLADTAVQPDDLGSLAAKSVVEKSDLASGVQTSLGLADTAVQPDDLGTLAGKSTVTDAELSANAVVTAKIKDGNVTKAKLESSVQTSLGLADTAVQPSALGTLAAKDTITASELSANAVVTAKISDGNVTKAKLETSVQTSLGKADTAVQPSALGTLAAKDVIGGSDLDAEFQEVIAGFDTDIRALKSVTHTEISAADINAMFNPQS